MTQIVSWAADAVLILLLGSTLVLALRLDRALRIVGSDRAAFEALVNSLGAATNAVKLGIQTLRSEAERAAHQLEQKSQDANKMATDLSFLIEAADRAGIRLEQKLETAPTTAAATSRLAGVMRELRGVKRYARQQPSDATGSIDPSATTSMSPPEPSTVPQPVCQAPVSAMADAAPVNLRQLAGITTRRRALDQADVAQPAITPEHDIPVVHDEAALEAAHIKMVG